MLCNIRYIFSYRLLKEDREFLDRLVVELDRFKARQLQASPTNSMEVNLSEDELEPEISEDIVDIR
jgi:hypothetical protein